jgi:hypothetical protein
MSLLTRLRLPLRILLIGAVCVAAPGCRGAARHASLPPGGGADPAAALAELVAAIPPGKILAFTGLGGVGGDSSEAAGGIYLRLEPVLVAACRERGVTLIERDKVQLILEEWKLEMTGLTRGDQGARELLGADVILTGSVRAGSPWVQVYLKTIGLKDGAILGAKELWLPAKQLGSTGPQAAKAPKQDAKPAAERPAAGKGNHGASPDGRVRLWSEAGSYAVGEKMAVYFEVTQAAYVTVIDVTPDGDKTIIFPNAFQTANDCKPGVTYRIPPHGASFSLQVTGPAGTDRVMALTSAKPGVDRGLPATRGLQFTDSLVSASESRASIAIDIRSGAGSDPP